MGEASTPGPAHVEEMTKFISGLQKQDKARMLQVELSTHIFPFHQVAAELTRCYSPQMAWGGDQGSKVTNTLGENI